MQRGIVFLSPEELKVVLIYLRDTPQNANLKDIMTQLFANRVNDEEDIPILLSMEQRDSILDSLPAPFDIADEHLKQIVNTIRVKLAQFNTIPKEEFEKFQKEVEAFISQREKSMPQSATTQTGTVDQNTSFNNQTSTQQVSGTIYSKPDDQNE